MLVSDTLSPSDVLPPLPAAPVEILFPPAETAGQVWRDGMMFVVSPGTVMPGRCLKCNRDTGGFQISKKISTISAWYPLFSSAGWNAHQVDDKPIYVSFGLCPRHRLGWLGRMSMIGLVVLGNVFSFLLCRTTNVLGAATDVVGILLPVLLVVIALSMRPMVRPRRVHHGLAWFAGAGVEFLGSLPDLEERRAGEVSPGAVEGQSQI
jgi:hypothetical protein